MLILKLSQIVHKFAEWLIGWGFNRQYVYLTIRGNVKSAEKELQKSKNL